MIRPEWYFRIEHETGKALHVEGNRQTLVVNVIKEILDGGCMLFRLPASSPEVNRTVPAEDPTA